MRLNEILAMKQLSAGGPGSGRHPYAATLEQHGFTHTDSANGKHTFSHQDGRTVHAYDRPPKYIDRGASNDKKQHNFEYVKPGKNADTYKTGKSADALTDLLTGKKKEAAPATPTSVSDKVANGYFKHIAKSKNPNSF